MELSERVITELRAKAADLRLFARQGWDVHAGVRNPATAVELQQAIALLRQKDFGVELKFGNYR